LEKLMIEFARNLEFEKAAKTRDQLAVLKEQIFGSNGNTNVVAFVENKAA
jgi:excinuclease ABC subunit B